MLFLGKTTRASCMRAMTTEKRKKQKGQALVEIGLALPVLCLLLLGVIKCGTAFNNWITLTEAVRIGGRTLSVNRLSNPNGCTLATTALQSAAATLPNANTITPTYSFAGNGGSSCSNLIAGDSGTVAATYPCDLRIFGINFAPGCTLSSQITERIE